jgi:hypothetical protein
MLRFYCRAGYLTEPGYSKKMPSKRARTAVRARKTAIHHGEIQPFTQIDHQTIESTPVRRPFFEQ